MLTDNTKRQQRPSLRVFEDSLEDLQAQIEQLKKDRDRKIAEERERQRREKEAQENVVTKIEEEINKKYDASKQVNVDERIEQGGQAALAKIESFGQWIEEGLKVFKDQALFFWEFIKGFTDGGRSFDNSWK